MFLTALSMKLKVNSEEFLMKREEFLEFVLVEFLLFLTTFQVKVKNSSLSFKSCYSSLLLIAEELLFFTFA